MRNRFRTWSSISRCWPAEQTTERTSGEQASRARITGAILIASGLVPTTVRTVIISRDGLKTAAAPAGSEIRDDGQTLRRRFDHVGIHVSDIERAQGPMDA